MTVEEYLAVLDAHGVSHGVLTAPSFYGTDNSLLLSALDAADGRLRGTVIVEPDIDRATLAAMDRRGVVGIRLNWVRRDTLPDVDSGDYRRLFATVRDLDWHVEIYLEGPKLATCCRAFASPASRSSSITSATPDPAQGVACTGFQAALAGVRAGDTWVKLSAPYRLGGVDPQRYVDALLDAGGPQQLVWASDWPFVSHENEITYPQCVGVAGATGFPTRTSSHRARDNAARLFRSAFARAANLASTRRLHDDIANSSARRRDGFAWARRGRRRGAQAHHPHRAGRRHRRLLPRARARKRSRILSEPIIVMNVPGAGGTIGVAQMVRARPTARRVAAVWLGPVTVSPNTMKVPYTPNDYIPVIQVSSAPYVLCVHPDFPASDGKGLIAELQQESRQVHLRQRRRRRPGPARHRAHPARDRHVARATCRSRAPAKR